MIRLDLGVPPTDVRQALEGRLATALATYDRHGGGDEVKALTGSGYDVTKPTLYDRQHKKCAYCERKPGYDGQPVEHFRPKKYAERALPGDPSDRDDDRYWWLAWTWENLYFACHTCNGRANKGNRFPLAPGSAILPLPDRPSGGLLSDASRDLGGETALLVDPRRVDPLDHIAWVPHDPHLHPSLWQWNIAGLTKVGRATIAVLGIDERDDDATDHFLRNIWRRGVERVEALVRDGDVAAAHGTWGPLIADRLDVRQDFRAASWCMLTRMRRRVPLLAAGLAEPARPSVS